MKKFDKRVLLSTGYKKQDAKQTSLPKPEIFFIDLYNKT